MSKIVTKSMKKIKNIHQKKEYFLKDRRKKLDKK